MTDSTDRVLASIDETLDDYVTWHGSGDSMSWEATPSGPFDEDAWLREGYIGDEETDAEVRTVTISVDVGRRTADLSNEWPNPEAAARVMRALNDALRPPFEALKSAFESLGRTVTKAVEANHPSFARRTMGDGYRRHRVRCRLCNPAGNPKPLKVNGAEYRRRTRARRRRNRR